MTFPKNSAFAQSHDAVREIFEQTEKRIAKQEEIDRSAVTVNLSDLELWYSTINAIVDHLPDYKMANGSNARDNLYDVRDSIYRLLP